jgi:hypothetical protein
MQMDEITVTIVVTPLSAAAAARRGGIDGFVELTQAERDTLPL